MCSGKALRRIASKQSPSRQGANNTHIYGSHRAQSMRKSAIPRLQQPKSRKQARLLAIAPSTACCIRGIGKVTSAEVSRSPIELHSRSCDELPTRSPLNPKPNPTLWTRCLDGRVLLDADADESVASRAQAEPARHSVQLIMEGFPLEKAMNCSHDLTRMCWSWKVGARSRLLTR